MANLLHLVRRTGANRRRNRRLSLDQMGIEDMLKRAVHPGEILKDELEELASVPDHVCSTNRCATQTAISQIVAGKRSVTSDTALRFGHWFGTRATVLAQPANPIRFGRSRTPSGIRNSWPAHRDEQADGRFTSAPLPSPLSLDAPAAATVHDQPAHRQVAR